MQPNIVMFISDQHRSSVAGCNGDPFIRTPNMDKLASLGVNFSENYCNSPLCIPSRASMLMGVMPHHNMIFNNTQSMPQGVVTLPHVMGAAGYETVLAGRMHFIGADQRHGFHKRLVGDITTTLYNNASNCDAIDHREQRYGYFKYCALQRRDAIERSGPGECAHMAYDQDVADSACSYLKSRNSSKPLFMVVGTYGPHNPYVAKPELFNYYYNILPDIDALDDQKFAALHPGEQRFLKNRGLGHESMEEIKRVRCAYYGMVEYEDMLLGQVIEGVKNTIGLDNTVLIYTSDHGDCIGDHGLFFKSNCREGAVKVPLIISWPKKFQRGLTAKGVTSLVDLAPTLIDISGAQKLPVMDGKNLIDTLENGTALDENAYVISEIADIKGDDPCAMIRKGKYKLIKWYGYKQLQLFDLEKDPDEDINLADFPEYTEIAAELLGLLSQNWNEDYIYQQTQTSKKHRALMNKWAETLTEDQFVDEWKQVGERRNRNYLCTLNS